MFFSSVLNTIFNISLENLTTFLIGFKHVAKNVKYALIFYLSYHVYMQTWLNSLAPK
jgi:hypothetical protein